METTLWDWHCFINKVVLSTFLKVKLQRKKKDHWSSHHPDVIIVIWAYFFCPRPYMFYVVAVIVYIQYVLYFPFTLSHEHSVLLCKIIKCGCTVTSLTVSVLSDMYCASICKG